MVSSAAESIAFPCSWELTGMTHWIRNWHHWFKLTWRFFWLTCRNGTSKWMLFSVNMFWVCLHCICCLVCQCFKNSICFIAILGAETVSVACSTIWQSGKKLVERDTSLWTCELTRVMFFVHPSISSQLHSNSTRHLEIGQSFKRNSQAHVATKTADHCTHSHKAAWRAVAHWKTNDSADKRPRKDCWRLKSGMEHRCWSLFTAVMSELVHFLHLWRSCMQTPALKLREAKKQLQNEKGLVFLLQAVSPLFVCLFADCHNAAKLAQHTVLISGKDFVYGGFFTIIERLLLTSSVSSHTFKTPCISTHIVCSTTATIIALFCVYVHASGAVSPFVHRTQCISVAA